MRKQNWTRKITAGLSAGLILATGGYLLQSLPLTTAAARELSTHPLQESSPLGLEVIEQACVQCHGLGLVFRQQKTADAWERTIAMMMWRGAPLLPGEARIIEDYLVSDYGQNLAPSSLTTSGDFDARLPEATGRSLVAEACVGCHDLTPIFSGGRSEEEWRRIVQEMVRLGSPLGEGETETVIGYLLTAFGP